MMCRHGLAPAGAIVLACAVFLLDAAAADTYQWVDENGTVWFADSLDKVPPEYRAWAYHKRKKIQEGPSVTTPGGSKSEAAPPVESSTSSSNPYASWQERIAKARGELEDLKRKRQKAQDDHIALRRQLWYQWGFIDTEIDAKMQAKISDLDQKIRDKEHEINTTIPDEARQAGVPAGVLSQ